MKIWYVNFAISGGGSAEVKADTKEEALEAFWSGEYLSEPKIEEWNVHTNESRGGYIDAVTHEEEHNDAD